MRFQTILVAALLSLSCDAGPSNAETPSSSGGFDFARDGEKFPHSRCATSNIPAGYEQGVQRPLKSISDSVVPEPIRFAVLVSQEGIGKILRSRAVISGLGGETSAVELATDRTAFDLTLDNIKMLWGPIREDASKQFSTCDAETLVGEKNLYHIDFKLNEANRLCCYRVRGIGISRPVWVSLSDTTGCQEDWAKKGESISPPK